MIQKEFQKRYCGATRPSSRGPTQAMAANDFVGTPIALNMPYVPMCGFEEVHNHYGRVTRSSGNINIYDNRAWRLQITDTDAVTCSPAQRKQSSIIMPSQETFAALFFMLCHLACRRANRLRRFGAEPSAMDLKLECYIFSYGVCCDSSAWMLHTGHTFRKCILADGVCSNTRCFLRVCTLKGHGLLSLATFNYTLPD